MKMVGGQIRLAGSDLSNHLACRHKTTLELQLARGERTAPDWADPDLAIILERGDRHEKDYLAHLAAQGLTVENLGQLDHKEEAWLLAETLALMECGAKVIFSHPTRRPFAGAKGKKKSPCSVRNDGVGAGQKGKYEERRPLTSRQQQPA
jgi:hypothetical protein